MTVMELPPGRKRYCLVCNWPTDHGFGAPQRGYIAHWYDSGERRKKDRGRHSRSVDREQPRLMAKVAS